MRRLKDALRRDLEWLLNTRRIAVPPDESLVEVNRSLYVFGLPDFTAFSLSSPKDQAKLVRLLQATLKLFEPRLANTGSFRSAQAHKAPARSVSASRDC